MEYTLEQLSGSALTARVSPTNASFRVVEVDDRMGVATSGTGRLRLMPLGPDDTLDDDWIVYVVGRR
ncbi:MAG: hypothetical protein AB2A00_28705 [Myxococcota bacterium]